MDCQRRWYDNDPTLSEAMELLSLSPDESKDMAADFILKLQEVIASDIIEKVYQTVKKYQGKGNRWYDSDPVMIKAIELLRVAPLNIQKAAAKKLLKALSSKELDELQKEFDTIDAEDAELFEETEA
jgi:hypothetical protein